jgi:hypothetical protein
MITTVTITGADDSIAPEELIRLAGDFPFVEWGILISRKQIGTSRFPSYKWLQELMHLYNRVGRVLPISMHLCGGYVRDFFNGEFTFLNDLPILWPMFRRVQLNSHGEPHTWSADPVAQFIRAHPDKQFIFQYDNVNTDLLEVLCQPTYNLKNVAALYDLSHGAGILPEEWPKPLAFCPVGYAGGLGPDNLATQIPLIENLVGDTPIWIDMETKVRSFTNHMPSQEVFDLNKVRACLETAKPFVKQLTHS